MESQFSEKLLVTFGVIADVQYADCENRLPVDSNSKTRFYRGALNQVDEAFKFWETCDTNVQFVLQLGDIIDGLSRIHGGSHYCLNKTLSHFEKHTLIPTFHTVGNHELYNFNRKELSFLFYKSMMKMNISPEIFVPLKPENFAGNTPKLYYKFCPVSSIKCISLDCFDVSVLGYDKTHPNYLEASEVLGHKHGHNRFEDWDSNGRMQGLEIRYQQMNGALGKEQLRWLSAELSESDSKGQKVIIFGHVGLHPDCTDWSCLLWNYEEVIDILHHHTCVVAYFCGHTHESGYSIDSHGISYIAFTGIVETSPVNTAFATISVYEDHLDIKGHGLERSYSISFKSKTDTKIIDVESDHDSSPATIKVQV